MKEMPGQDFARLGRFTEAMTHGSYGADSNNKQLALLGDAVIDLAVCEYILENSPEQSVGAITEQKAAVVNSSSLAQKARALNLERFLLLGEQLRVEEETEHILAEALEALAGAVFAEHGYERAKQFVSQYIIPETIVTEAWNPKGKLQELIHASGLGIPKYDTREISEGTKKMFRTIICIEGAPHGSGEGKSKREAEEQAAQNALSLFYERAT